MSSSEEFSNGNDMSQLIGVLQKMQLADDEQTEPNQRVDRITNEDSKLTMADINVLKNFEPGDMTNAQSYPKRKRGWEEIQRGWGSYFPKRAWDVVRSYWQMPHFRTAYKSYLAKRNNEEMVDIPVQPENEKDQWMIDEVGYKVDSNDKVVPASFSGESKVAKRKWDIDNYPSKRDREELRPFPASVFRKKGWEDVRLFGGAWPGKRGWEDVRLFGGGRPGKRGWEDVRLLGGGQPGKRGWEDVRLFQNGRIGKRGWEDVRLFANSQIGNGRWDAFRYFPDRRRGKRGWEDVRLFPDGRFGKRGWEDIRLFQHNRLGKRDLEDVVGH